MAASRRQAGGKLGDTLLFEERMRLRLKKEKCAYDALCYHASGLGVAVRNALDSCEGMFGSLVVGPRPTGVMNGKKRLDDLASKVPDDCNWATYDMSNSSNWSNWAEAQLQGAFPDEYERMVKKAEEQGRQMRANRTPHEQAAFEALRYHASGEALGMAHGWAHCDGMFGCYWGCSDFRNRQEIDLRNAASTLAQQVPDGCGRMVLDSKAKELLKMRWPKQYRTMELAVKERTRESSESKL